MNKCNVMKIPSFLELAIASNKSYAFGSSHVHTFGFPTKFGCEVIGWSFNWKSSTSSHLMLNSMCEKRAVLETGL